MKRKVYKPYIQKQTMLLLPKLDEMIPEGHLVRVINEMIEQIEMGVFFPMKLLVFA